MLASLFSRQLHAVLLSLLFAQGVFAQTRCGKVYKPGQGVVPPGGQFPIPASATTAQLALRCNPAIIPFLPDDVGNNSTSLIIVDVIVRDEEIAGGQNLSLFDDPVGDPFVSVDVLLDGLLVASGNVSLYESAALPFNLSTISPRTQPYNLTCNGTMTTVVPEQYFSSLPTNLTYLPSPPGDIGTITKFDLRTGGFFVKQANTEDPYQSIFPIGFSTTVGTYLENGGQPNAAALEELGSQGFNVVLPLSPYDAGFWTMANIMYQYGLWMIYDLRWDYKDLTSLAAEIQSVKGQPGILMYHTAYEPDGFEDPLGAPAAAAALINSLDPYRPTALTLHCQDYLFSDYATGTQVLLQDAWPIAINSTYSVQYQTPCTTEQGDCGCDNCVGDFEDIRDRIDNFTMRLDVLGWERNQTVWTVPQAFQDTEFWSRPPTGNEVLVQIIVGVNAGARGCLAWNDPADSAEQKLAMAAFASALPKLTPFLLSSSVTQPSVQFQHVITPNRVDIGVWISSTGQTLVLAANLNYFAVSIMLDQEIPNWDTGNTTNSRMVMDGGATLTGVQITFDVVKTGAWIFSSS